MIISAQAMMRYLTKMSFPMPIFAEKGEQIVYQAVNQGTIQELIEDGAIIGIGTWNRIKRVRLNPNASPSVKERLKKEFGFRIPTAEDNSTIIKVSRTFTHHAARSSSYGRGNQL